LFGLSLNFTVVSDYLSVLIRVAAMRSMHRFSGPKNLGKPQLPGLG